MRTDYIGKVIGNRVLVICQNDKGQKIQIPHVDMMKEDGLVMVGYEGNPREPLRYLTRHEVYCFLNGIGIDGAVLETPAEMRARFERETAEMMKDPEFRKLVEEIKQERGR